MIAEKTRELDEIAMRIFDERLRHNSLLIERTTLDSYKLAEQWLSVRDGIRAGTISTAKDTGPKLADVSAPNLSQTHPLNLVSRRFGNLDRVNQINAWLVANPTGDEPEKMVAALNKKFGDLNWGFNEIYIARETFPKYCPAQAH